MGFNPIFYAGRPKISEVTIDSDLDMGGRAVIAPKGRFAEIDKKDDSGINIIAPARFNDIARFGETVFEDTMVIPYTVTPSDNVYYTSNISASSFSRITSPISGSIVIGPTGAPISPRLYFDVEFTATNLWVALYVYKNSDRIGGPITAERYDQDPNMVTKSLDLPELVGGDVLTFAAIASEDTTSVKVSNFRLAGDVVKYIIDEPSAETVYD